MKFWDILSKRFQDPVASIEITRTARACRPLRATDVGISLLKMVFQDTIDDTFGQS